MSRHANTRVAPDDLRVAIFVVLLAAKLLGLTDISWWWVTLPLWFGIAISFGFLILTTACILAIGVVMLAWEYKRNGWKSKP